MSGGQWLVIKPEAQWAAQVRDALDAIIAANGGNDPATIREAYDIDADAFGRMIEGLYALGARMAPDLMELAGMRDVGEFL